MREEATRMNKRSFYREQSRSKPDTETDRSMMLLLKMYLSYYNVSWEIKDMSWSYYKTMEHLFRGWAVEKRAASLICFIVFFSIKYFLVILVVS